MGKKNAENSFPFGGKDLSFFVLLDPNKRNPRSKEYHRGECVCLLSGIRRGNNILRKEIYTQIPALLPYFIT